MRSTWGGITCLLTCSLILATALLPGQVPTRTLRVKARYLGPGVVDSMRGIHLYLFDTPNINEGAMPIRWASVYENGRVAEFTGLTATKVYLVAGYGEYELTGPPPSGTPVSQYRPGDQEGPTPIHLIDEVSEIEFSFDDSIRMP